MRNSYSNSVIIRNTDRDRQELTMQLSCDVKLLKRVIRERTTRYLNNKP